jgi:GT2 family glycosyltransferase
MIKFIVARNLPNDSEVIQNYFYKSVTPDPDGPDHVMEITTGHSIFEKYNKGIEAWWEDPYDPMNDDDIVCFMHEDILIRDENFAEKVNYIFTQRKNVGVLGVIGTKEFPLVGGWWLSPPHNHTGHIYQGRPDLPQAFHMIKKIEYTEEVVSVDGCCFFVRAKLLRDLRFDDTTFGGYHFYDVDYCFSALEKGYDVAVADITIEHLSQGPLNDGWYYNRDLFIKKWQDKGLVFPVHKSNFKNLVH